MEEVAEIPEPVDATPAVEVDAPAETPQEAPSAKRRGRPPGSRNKPRIVVEAPQPPEPTPTPPAQEPTPGPPQAPVVMKTPRAKKPAVAKEAVIAKPMPEPQLPAQTPHQTFLTAMAAWQQMAAADRQARANHYNRLVEDMFR